MKWGSKIILFLSAMVTWFAAAAIYNEFGFDSNPDGMLRAITGLVLIGPLVAAVQTWIFVSTYRRVSSDVGKRRLVAGLMPFSIVLLVLAQMSTK